MKFFTFMILAGVGMFACRVSASGKMPEMDGLVARYVAQDVKTEDGKVREWPARSGSNPIPLRLMEKVEEGRVVTPELKTVEINAFKHPCVQFASGKEGEVELLKAKALLSDGHKERTVFAVYWLSESSESGAARLGGFGSGQTSEYRDLRVWNFGLDTSSSGKEHGSFRFDGTFVGPQAGNENVTGKVMVRAMVMHADGKFSDYIQPTHDFFRVNRVLNGEKPPKGVGPFPGDFFIGDVHTASQGGEAGAFDWSLFEVQIYDRALKEAEIEQVLKGLNWRYTNPVS
jgi:hypothetical protein